MVAPNKFQYSLFNFPYFPFTDTKTLYDPDCCWYNILVYGLPSVQCSARAHRDWWIGSFRLTSKFFNDFGRNIFHESNLPIFTWFWFSLWNLDPNHGFIASTNFYPPVFSSKNDISQLMGLHRNATVLPLLFKKGARMSEERENSHLDLISRYDEGNRAMSQCFVLLQ